MLLLALGNTWTATAQVPSPTEESAFRSAAGLGQEQRIEALLQFLHSYPDGAHHREAAQLAFKTLLRFFPDRTFAIHEAANALILDSPAGLERWMEQAHVAQQLADAGETETANHGADLPDAQTWAEDALHHISAQSYPRELASLSARLHLPPPRATLERHQFAADRAASVTALGAVRLRQQQLPEARQLAAEAMSLEPLSVQANRLQAEVLLAAGSTNQALAALLRANALAPLPPPLRKQEEALFRDQQTPPAQTAISGTAPENDPTLERRIDQVYRSLYPAPFQLAPRRLPAGGHTVLLELFTGSDCLPCTGADLAVDSLLRTYSSPDLAVLSWDEPIPVPDPLATPASEQRAGFYGVERTPTAFLDGAPVELPGSSRADVQNLVVSLADDLESEAAVPSSLRLALTLQTAGSSVTAKLRLQRATATVAAGQSATEPALGRAVVYVALAQDDLRYTGANGVRLHRMVVRAMEQQPALSVLDHETPIAFDLTAIARTNAAYLAADNVAGARQGTAQNTVNFPIIPDQLVVVAWVQDMLTRQIWTTVSAPAKP